VRGKYRLTPAVAVFLLMACLSVIQPVETSTIVSGSVAGQSTTYEGYWVLNNSYYMHYISFPGSSVWDVMVKDYYVLNVDNDNYTDFLIWYWGRLVLWSYCRGVIWTYTPASTTPYLQRPLPVDIDSNGVTDYIIAVENSYMDARLVDASQTPVSSVRSRIVRITSYGSGQVLASYTGWYVISETYYIYNKVIFLPAIITWYYSSSCTAPETPCTYTMKVGLVAVDLQTWTARFYDIKTYTATFLSNKHSTNDFSTSYEIYIAGLGNKLYLIPSGMDLVLELIYNPSTRTITVNREVSLGYPDYSDKILVLGRRSPPPSALGYTFLVSYNPDYFWRAPQYAEIKLVGNRYLVMPLANFFALRPQTKEWNSDINARVERIDGVFILDLNTYTVYTRSFFGRSITVGGSSYAIRSVTSIAVADDGSMYLGAIGMQSYSVARVLLKYDWVTDSFEVLWHTGYRTSGQLIRSIPPNNLVVSRIHGTNVYAANRDFFFNGSIAIPTHVSIDLTSGGAYTVIVNPARVDVDGDGLQEYVFMFSYLRNSQYVYGDGPANVFNIAPYLYQNNAYLVFFKNPTIRVRVVCTDETCYKATVSVLYTATSISNGTLTVYYSGSQYYTGSITPNTWNSYNLTFSQTGAYYISLVLNTNYYICTVMPCTTGRVVTYRESLNYALEVQVRMRTRLTIVEPTLTTLTPNLYTPSFTVRFKLEYQPLGSTEWYSLQITASLLSVTVYNGGQVLRATPSLDTLYGYYRASFSQLQPAETTITAEFHGSADYLPSAANITVNLIPYLVVIELSSGEMVYAITQHRVNAAVAYKYLDSSGSWQSAPLSTGSLEFKVYIGSAALYSGRTPVTNGSAQLILVEELLVVPGTYRVVAEYIPPSTYYSASTATAYFRVLPINYTIALYNTLPGEPVDNESAVIRGSVIRLEALDVIGGYTRKTVSGIYAVFAGSNTEHQYSSAEPVLEVDTGEFEPGEYTVLVYPLKYREAYSNIPLVYRIAVVKPSARISIDLDIPLELEFKASMPVSPVATYALTPVTIKAYVYAEDELTAKILSKYLSENNLKISVQGAEYAVGNGTPITWIPVKPGVARIYAVLDTPILKLANYTELVAYPMPVNITIEKGSIVINVIDILGRPAYGVLRVAVYDLRKNMLYSGVFEVSGSLILKDVAFRGWVYVVAEFKGNESYREGYARKLLYFDVEDYSVPTPLPETPLLSITVLTVITVVLSVKTVYNSVWRKTRYAG